MESDRLSTDVIRARNLLACVVRVHPEDAEAITAARGNLAAAHIARSIAQNADALDADSRARLAVALLGSQTPADPRESAFPRSGRRATNGGSR